VVKPTRWTRVFRGALAASFATFVAGFSHVAGGGALPNAGVLAFCLALAWLVCIAFVGRTHSAWRTTVSVGLSQFVFHALFSSMSGSGVTVTSTSPLHGGHALPVLQLDDAAAAAAGGHSLTMWSAHAIAAAITVLALLYTDSACRTLRSSGALVVARLLAWTVPTAIPRPHAAVRVGSSRTVRVRDLTILFSTLRHRGPPALHAA